ncbi:MAG: hypothetical protein WAW42_06735 [Candidatus Competibacteraceae bacterium]
MPLRAAAVISIPVLLIRWRGRQISAQSLANRRNHINKVFQNATPNGSAAPFHPLYIPFISHLSIDFIHIILHLRRHGILLAIARPQLERFPRVMEGSNESFNGLGAQR